MNIRKKPPILYYYIFREILVPFIGCLLVFTGILFLLRSLKLFDLVVNKSVPLGDIISLFALIIPKFLEIALPMSLLIGVMLAFGRLSAESELTIMRSSGLSLQNLTKPVVNCALIAFFATLFLSVWIRPWANHQLGIGMFEIAKVKASSGLEAGIFNDFGQLTIYAEEVSKSGRINNVVISDRRNPNSTQTFFSKYGEVIPNEKRRTLTLRLYDGSIHEGSNLNYNVTYFDNNNINLTNDELLEGGPVKKGKKHSEMYITELLEEIRAGKSDKDEKIDARYAVELHSRFALPAACLCVAIIAMALGIQPSRGGTTWGPAANALFGLLLIVLYYLLFGLFKAIARDGNNLQAFMIWIPNILFMLIAIYCYKSMGSEKWQSTTEKIKNSLFYLPKNVSRLVKRDEN